MSNPGKDLIVYDTKPEEKSQATTSIRRNDKEDRVWTPEVAELREEQPRPTLASLWRRRPKPDPNAIATQPSVFDDPEQAKYFQPLSTYENLHRFDPSERWTWAEEQVCFDTPIHLSMHLLKHEQKVLSKIEWRIAAWAAIAFFALDLDRSNIQQANTDNFLEDLGLNTNGTLRTKAHALSSLCCYRTSADLR
jgi:hypothetical protein